MVVKIDMVGIDPLNKQKTNNSWRAFHPADIGLDPPSGQRPKGGRPPAHAFE